MEKAPPLFFRIYRRAMRLCTPFALALLDIRAWQGKENPARLLERRGIASAARPPGALIWIHAVSVGETLAVLPMIGRLTALGFEVLLTTLTPTSASLATERIGEHAHHQFIPLDVPAWIDRFLAHWKPQLAFFVEQELWPNILYALKEQKIPIVLLNARLSERSFRRWRRWPYVAGWLLGFFDLILALGSQDAERYELLGGKNVHVVGNLKFDAAALPAPAVDVSTLGALLKGRTVWAAASTHKGEDEQILNVIAQLKLVTPNLLTLLAPRHPKRGEEILRLANAQGLKAARRSLRQWPQNDTDIFIFDTIGELGLVYRVANIVFMGGSLIAHGGQNPIEPAQLGGALLYGPYVENFAEIYDALCTSGGAQCVHDAKDLRSSLRSLFDRPDRIQAMAERARETVGSLGGALDGSLILLQPLLDTYRILNG